jgi:hypothetical protein
VNSISLLSNTPLLSAHPIGCTSTCELFALAAKFVECIVECLAVGQILVDVVASIPGRGVKFAAELLHKPWILASIVAAWRKEDVRKASSTPRVRVEMRRLKQWYRTLDELLARKND